MMGTNNGGATIESIQSKYSRQECDLWGREGRPRASFRARLASSDLDRSSVGAKSGANSGTETN